MGEAFNMYQNLNDKQQFRQNIVVIILLLKFVKEN